MTSRASFRRLLVSSAIRGTISTADSLRRFWFIALLCLAMIAAGAVWPTARTKAASWAWKSWERLFGGSRQVVSTSGSAIPDVSGAGGGTLTSFDEPSDGSGAMEGTFGTAINASGTITGIYSNQSGQFQGFLLNASGAYTSFVALDAGTSGNSSTPEGTFPMAINSAGDVAGFYVGSNAGASGNYESFIRTSNGTLVEFNAPGASISSNRGTAAMAINDSDEIVGFYNTGSYLTTTVYHGFLRSADGTTFTTIDPAGAGTGECVNSHKQGTMAFAINDSGMIAGTYIDSSCNRHGFVRDTSGNYTSIDPPGASESIDTGNMMGTWATGIDAAGDVVGNYTDSSGIRHGFIRSASGAITTSDVPNVGTGGTGNLQGTLPYSIDPTGSYIAGSYTDSTGLLHGFIRFADGSFATFASSAASSSAALGFSGTLGPSVNSSGLVTGGYLDSNTALHGILFTPNVPATPTFSPGGGNYTSTQSVTISDTTSGATIYYTTDGSTPTTSSSVYSSPISVSSSETINAIAFVTEEAYSPMASATYTINYPAATTTSLTPAPTPNPSVYGEPVTLTASVSSSGGPPPNGENVTFMSGATSLGTAQLTSGVASLTTTALPLGTDSITAVYGGDTNFAGSTSNAVSQVVDESDSLGYTYSVYDLLGSPTDGSMIMSGISDTQGNVYGVTAYGGANSCDPPYPAAYGCGAIVKMDASGNESVLHSFAGTDGAMPLGGLVLDGQGNLYGTTYAGGNLTCNSGEGCGTVFKLNLTTVTFTVVHSFTGSPDGMFSEEPLLLDAQGNLYGTTDDGGANSNGTVFKVDTAGNESVIYSAAAGPEWGAQLGAIDAQGNIYGTTRGGGADSEGSVFEINSSNAFTTLYSFTGGADGSNPRGLKRDAQGNLYGITKSGSLYKLTLQANGTYVFSTVQNFVGAGAGVWPGGTVIDAQGNQYGTASAGGDLSCDAPTGCGTVYKIDTSSNQTVLHAFTGSDGDGAGPSGLMPDLQGNLYGGTGGGNSSCSAPGGTGALVTGCGTIFKLALPASIATTTTTLKSSQNPSVPGQTVTFTATVVASAGTAPNGETIAFMYGQSFWERGR